MFNVADVARRRWRFDRRTGGVPAAQTLKTAFPRLLLLSQFEHVPVTLLPGFGDAGQGIADPATGISGRTPCPAIIVTYPLDTPP